MSHWKDFSIDAVVSPVDFSFNSDDKDILAYYALLLLALEELYYLYEFKSADYVLSHIDEDISKLQKSMLDNVNQLDKSFNEKYRDTLTKEGILPENIGKIKTLNKELLKFLKKEQTQTIKNICQELKGQLKSKIFYLKSRNSDRLFSVNSNFSNAVRRLRKLADYGVKSSRGMGQKEAELFLYGDTLVYWECLHDGKTCGFCLENEALSPFNLSDCPAYPAHVHCGSRCNLVIKDEDKTLTPDAEDLKYYQIGE